MCNLCYGLSLHEQGVFVVVLKTQKGAWVPVLLNANPAAVVPGLSWL